MSTSSTQPSGSSVSTRSSAAFPSAATCTANPARSRNGARFDVMAASSSARITTGRESCAPAIARPILELADDPPALFVVLSLTDQPAGPQAAQPGQPLSELIALVGALVRLGGGSGLAAAYPGRGRQFLTRSPDA